MPSINLTDKELIFLKFVMANLLLKAMQEQANEQVGTIVGINEALAKALKDA